MKRYTITQTGSETVSYERRFVVQIPESMEKEDFDQKVLEQLADDEWIDWETHDEWNEGIRLTDQEINSTDDQEDGKLPVLQYPPRIRA